MCKGSVAQASSLKRKLENNNGGVQLQKKVVKTENISEEEFMAELFRQKTKQRLTAETYGLLMDVLRNNQK